MSKYIRPFREINLSSLPEVGGKNASLGEMFSSLQGSGIRVPDGFAVTVEAFREFLSANRLEPKLESLLQGIDAKSLSNLPQVAKACRKLIAEARFSPDLARQIKQAYGQLAGSEQAGLSVAVRSSATAEDLPSASFAGQHDSFLNISGGDRVIEAVHRCYVSLYNDRAIKYRIDNKVSHMQVGLSVGIQQMVRSDLGCAGVIFTIDPESGFGNAIYITGAWGLGESIVQGAVDPDEFWVFKPAIAKGKRVIIGRKKGKKQVRMVYAGGNDPDVPVLSADTSAEMRQKWILSDEEVGRLATWSYRIESHYGMPMDIEWAKDGQTGDLYILQARPETVHSNKNAGIIESYQLEQAGKKLCAGKAVGKKIVSGRACVIRTLADAPKLRHGDILIAENTDPDWNALLRKAVGIVTEKGGRTSHASIVARELGIPAIVGTGDATAAIRDGQMITLSNTEGETGTVFEGKLPFKVTTTNISDISQVTTAPMLILADPDQAFGLSLLPSRGVGLLRMEFIINNSIRIHPMALARYGALPENIKTQVSALTADYADKEEFFVASLAEAIAKVAAAFHPRPVVLRLSDFKSNEYRALLGGDLFEPREENPMLGFRGASRYYDDRYKDGFALECRAIGKVRAEMGFDNVKVMVPFCRTLEEARKVLETMEGFGLVKGSQGLQVYVMVELPVNVLQADEFAKLFDGFSIGSNDLTQLILGLDRDSEIVSHLFNENNPAVMAMIAQAIRAAKTAGISVGLCGQAPSDYPSFTEFLVKEGIDSISFTPDALVRGIANIAGAEHQLAQAQNPARK